MHDDQLPKLSAYKEIRCRDISPQGFSYVASRPPEYTQAVVAFGAHPNLVYLTAEVRHMTPHEHDGRKQFLIGCSYTGRAAY